MLLDTQVLVWHGINPECLSRKAIAAIEKRGCFYSHVSLWELAIKSGLNKLNLALREERVSARQFVLHLAERLELTPLALEFDDLAAVESLPRHPQRNDPFDRLLAIQAQRRDLSILSADTDLDFYGLPRVW